MYFGLISFSSFVISTPNMTDTDSLPVQERLLFAVPKKGRLYEKCIKLLQLINVDYRRKNRLDIALSTNMNVALVFLPAADIPTYVSDGRVDLGITGQDMVAEKKAHVRTLTELHFGRCKLCVQAPVASNVSSFVCPFLGKRS